MKDVEFFSPGLDEIYRAILDICCKIVKSGVKIDVIIGISRGGLIPARFFSDLLNVNKIEVVKAEYYTGIMERVKKPIVHVPDNLNVKDQNILIVDDVADTGDTIMEIEEVLVKRGANKVYKATLFTKPWNKAKIDFHYKEVNAWIIFPWEIAETMRIVSEDEKVKVYESLKIPRESLEKIVEIVEGQKGK